MSEMEDACCSDDVNAPMVAHSGGSNAGQVVNNTVVGLGKDGINGVYCLAGTGAALSGFIGTAGTIPIDGPPVGCAEKIFGKCGVAVAHYFVVTGMGTGKKRVFNMLSEETAHAVDYVRCNV